MKSRILLPAILLAAATSVYAQPSGSVDDDDNSEAEIGGPEATSMLKIHLQDVVGVIVTQSPDLAKAKFDRTIAKDQAEAERRNQAWVMSASTSYSQNGIADHVEAPPWSVVEQDTFQGTVGLGRNLPTGGSVSLEVGVQHQHTEYNVLDTLQNMTTTASSTGAGSGSSVPDENAYSINSHVQITW